MEDTESDEVRQWAGARENYTIREHPGGALLTVEVDSSDDHRKYFDETWPKALAALKDLSERRVVST